MAGVKCKALILSVLFIAIASYLLRRGGWVGSEGAEVISAVEDIRREGLVGF